MCSINVVYRGAIPLLIIFVILISKDGFSYEKIVSLVPSVTKQIILLGKGDNIVGKTTFCPPYKGVNDKAKIVGSAVEANIEKIYHLKPDLVILGSLNNSRDIEKLKSLKLNVKIFPYPKSLEDIFQQTLEIGKLVNSYEKALTLVKNSREKLSMIQFNAKKHTPKKVFIQIGVKPLFTAPKGTYIDDALTKINLINIAGDTSNGMFNREIVISRNPDIILIMDMGGIGKNEISNWKKFTSISAVKNNKIFIIDANKLGSYALPEFIDYIEEIAEIVHR